MISKSGGFVLAAVLLPWVAQSQPLDRENWAVELRYAHSLEVSGSTRVREFDIRGDHLDLEDDLGVEQWNTYEIEIARRLKSGDRIRISSFYSEFKGSALVDEPIDYNGATYAADQTLSIEPTTFWRMMLLYEYSLSRPNERSGLYALLGLYSDNLHVMIDGELAPDTASDEKGEDFGRQKFIWPTLGMGGRSRLGESLELWGEFFGWHYAGTDTFYGEGGEIHATQSAFDAVAGARLLGVLLRPALAYRYRYFYQATTSTEDYNEALFRGHFLELSLQARF